MPNTEKNTAPSSVNTNDASNDAPPRIVFISHSNPEDNDFTTWLAARLALAGYEVWSDITKLIDKRIQRLRARLRSGDPDLAPDELEAALAKAEENRRSFLNVPSVATAARAIAILPSARDKWWAVPHTPGSEGWMELRLPPSSAHRRPDPPFDRRDPGRQYARLRPTPPPRSRHARGSRGSAPSASAPG